MIFRGMGARERDDAVCELVRVVESMVRLNTGNETATMTTAGEIEEAAMILGDFMTLGLQWDVMRSVETSAGTLLQVLVPSKEALSVGLSLGPFSLHSLSSQYHPFSVHAVTWATNPHGSVHDNVSQRAASFSVRSKGESLSLSNLEPELFVTLEEHEPFDVAGGFRSERECVFFNTSSLNWSTSGLRSVRKNLTRVQCASTHATTFAVRVARRACRFCAAAVPAGFYDWGSNLSVTSWCLVTLLFLAYLPCLLLHSLDRRDWTTNRAHFRPQARSKLGSRSGIRKVNEANTAVPANLLVEAPSGSLQVHVSCPLAFRLGRRLVINPGGTTEEHRTVKAHTRISAVFSESLQYKHDAGERVMEVMSSAEVVETSSITEECSKESFATENSSGRVAAMSWGTQSCEERPTESEVDETSSGEVVAMSWCAQVDEEIPTESAVTEGSSSEIVAMSWSTQSSLESHDELNFGPSWSTCDYDTWVEDGAAHVFSEKSLKQQGHVAHVLSDESLKQQGHLSTAQQQIVGTIVTAYPRSATEMAFETNAWHQILSVRTFAIPFWALYSVHMRRTQRYSIVLTTVLATFFFQCMMFVLSDGCVHEPRPVLCQPVNSLMDFTIMVQSLWGTLFSCCISSVIFTCFHKPFIYGPRTHDEKKAILRYRWRMEIVGWVAVVLFTLVCVWHILRITQYYSFDTVWRWVYGSVLSSVSLMAGSPVMRALQFLRFVATRWATDGRRLL